MVQILPMVLSPKLFEALQACGQSSLEPDFSLPNPCGGTYHHRCQRAVLFRAYARRPALHLRSLGRLPRPLWTVSSLEDLDGVFGIDVACSAPNGGGANQIPADCCLRVS